MLNPKSISKCWATRLPGALSGRWGLAQCGEKATFLWMSDNTWPSLKL